MSQVVATGLKCGNAALDWAEKIVRALPDILSLIAEQGRPGTGKV
jgi:hypothetical protein